MRLFQILFALAIVACLPFFGEAGPFRKRTVNRVPVVPVVEPSKPVVLPTSLKLVEKVYKVADLVDYFRPNPNISKNGLNLAGMNSKTSASEKNQNSNQLWKELIKLIQNSVAPDSWMVVGGKGSIHFQFPEKALVVIQTEEAQEDIAALLAALRTLCELQISMEVQLIEISDKQFNNLGWKWTQNGEILSPLVKIPDINALPSNSDPEKFKAAILEAERRSKHSVGLVALDDQRFQEFSKFIESHPENKIIHPVKVHIFNGELITLKIVDGKVIWNDWEILQDGKQIKPFVANVKQVPTFQLDLCPIASAYRTGVRVGFGYRGLHTNSRNLEIVGPWDFPLDGRFVQPLRDIDREPGHKILSIPNDRTVILHCGKSQQNNPAAPDKAPSIKEVGTTHFLLTITPRIIISKREEDPIYKNLPSPIPRP
jgi:hypothetical protein